MSASPVVGIDLGTTNSVVAVADSDRVVVLPDADGECLTPSAVSFHPSGEVLVGRRARDRRMVDATNTVVSVKRLIGRPYRSAEVRQATGRLPFELVEGATGGVMVRARGEAYSLPEVSAFVLRRLKGIAESALDQTCVHAVVTVPANFNELQRTATRDAGRIAGLNVLRILNEPTAAALAYGYGNHMRKRVAVYDLGGGTFDVSILDLSGDVIEVIGTAGDTYLGGDDVDSLIVGRLSEAFLRQHRIDLSGDPQATARMRMAAEWLKCSLSERSSATARLEEIAYGEQGRAIDFSFEFARAELEHLAAPLFGRTFDICERAMKVAGVRPAQLDAVVLVGGQTRSPQVRSMVAEYFGKQPLTTVDPDQVVAQGAALQALSLAGGKQKVRLRARLPSTAHDGAGAAAPGRGFDDAPTRVSVKPGELAQPVGVSAGGAPGVAKHHDGTRQPFSSPVEPDSRTATGAPQARSLAPPPPMPRAPSIQTRTGLGGLDPEEKATARLRASRAPKPPPLSDVIAQAQKSGGQGATSYSPPAPTPEPAEPGRGQPLARVPLKRSSLPPPPPSGRTRSTRPSDGTRSPSGPVAGQTPPPIPPAAVPLGSASPSAAKRSSPAIAMPRAPDVRPSNVPGRTAAGQRRPSRGVGEPRLPAPSPTASTPASQRISATPPLSPLPSQPVSTPASQPPATLPASKAPGVPVSRTVVSERAAPAERASSPVERADGPSDFAAASLAPGIEVTISSMPPALQVGTEWSMDPVPQSAPLPAEWRESPGPTTAPPRASESRPEPPVQPSGAVPTVSPSTPPVSPAPPPSPEPAESPKTATPARRAPLLLDVTPLSLAVETAGGYCEAVIGRNAAIPTEQGRVFCTSQDNQAEVVMRICQGEARVTDDNQVLGTLHLAGLRRGARGEVTLAVVFLLDADGTLRARATDQTTGTAQEVRINLVGALSDDEVDALRRRQDAQYAG